VNGDISAQRISIEEGAFLKGKVDIHRTDGK
jgi:cytoskeletal protein CcmA (bactofilin family)